MSDWGKLDCPTCGMGNPPPDPRTATNDDEYVYAALTCVECGHAWRHQVELWRYYGVSETLPSREDDR